MSDRVRAVVIAGHRGDVPTARAGLVDADPHVRVAALGALDRAGGLTDGEVRAGLTDTSATVRRRACELAARRPLVELRAVLDDPEPAVVEAAAWACGEQVPVAGEVVDRLVALAAEAHDPLVREAAIAALGAIGDDRARVVTVRAATGDRPAVRRRAVVALAAYSGDDVDRALRTALTDRDWQVRQAAEELLRAIGAPDDD